MLKKTLLVLDQFSFAFPAAAMFFIIIGMPILSVSEAYADSKKPLEAGIAIRFKFSIDANTAYRASITAQNIPVTEAVPKGCRVAASTGGTIERLVGPDSALVRVWEYVPKGSNPAAFCQSDDMVVVPIALLVRKGPSV